MKKEDDEKIVLKITKYDNNARSGLYIYIKKEGYPSRVYKYGGDVAQFDATKQYYLDTVVYKMKPASYEQYKKTFQQYQVNEPSTLRTGVKNRADAYVKRIKKQGGLLDTIKRGLQKTTLAQFLTVRPDEFKHIKRQLLQPLILDPQILNQLSTDENFNKLRNRLDYEMTAVDENGTVLVTGFVHGKTINTVQTELRNAIQKSNEISKAKYRFLDYLKSKKWQLEKIGDGRIQDINVSITLRNG